MLSEELRRRLEDDWSLCNKRGQITHTDFLRPEELEETEPYLLKRGIRFLTNGGYLGAEKQAIFFLPDWMEEEQFNPSEYICAVEIVPADKKEHPHRDYLGSLMSLGMKRSKMGDVQALTDRGRVVCFPEISRLILGEMTRLGGTSVKCISIPMDTFPETQKEVQVIAESVPSMRADVLAGAAFHKSRSAISAAILRGDLFCGGKEQTKVDQILVPPCQMILRGSGKAEFVGTEGKTRKGRWIAIFNILK